MQKGWSSSYCLTTSCSAAQTEHAHFLSVNIMLCQRRISLSYSRESKVRAQSQQQTDFTSSLMEKFVLLLVLLSPAASDVVQVKPGDEVTLPCQTGEASIRAVEWSRPELESEYVLFYRDGGSVSEHQHPSFKDRVQLVDRELKDGDVSLILKNVSRNDAGTYECRVATEGSRRKRANIETEPIRTYQLKVSGSHKGHYGLGAAFVLVCSAAVVVGLKYRSHKNKKPEQSAADEAGSDQLI